MADDVNAMLSESERYVPTPGEILDVLLRTHDEIKERGFNQATQWSAMSAMHVTIRMLYAPPKMPDLSKVITELDQEEIERLTGLDEELLRARLSEAGYIINDLWRCNDDSDRKLIAARVADAIKRYACHPDKVDTT